MPISIDKLPENIGGFIVADEAYLQQPKVRKRIERGYLPVVDPYGYVGFIRADLSPKDQERYLRGVFTRKFRRDWDECKRVNLRYR